MEILQSLEGSDAEVNRHTVVSLHSFSGTDFGGKFAGIGKIKWLTSYWNLEEDSDIIQTFINLGEQEIDPLVLQSPRKKPL